jgi:hypothetical protein
MKKYFVNNVECPADDFEADLFASIATEHGRDRDNFDEPYFPDEEVAGAMQFMEDTSATVTYCNNCFKIVNS